MIFPKSVLRHHEVSVNYAQFLEDCHHENAVSNIIERSFTPPPRAKDALIIQEL
jgi:hypothetical protein